MLFLLNILYTFGLVASWAFAAAIFMQKPSHEQKLMEGLTLFTAVAWLGYWLGVGAQDLGELIMAEKVIYTGSCHIYFFLLLFMLRYCRIEPPKVLCTLLCGINCAINAAVLTMDTNSLFIKDAYLSEHEGLKVLCFHSGIAHTAYVIVSMGYCAALLVIAIVGTHRERDRFVGAGGLALSVLIPTALNTLYASGYTQENLTPVGYLISELIIFILIYSNKLYDVQDTAREFIIDSLEDAIVVVDRYYHLKGYNGRAKQIFPELAYAKTDMRIEDACPDINQILYERGHSDINSGERVYRPSIRKIADEKSQVVKGYVIWLTDVTEQIRNMELLNNYQRDLERDVEKKTQQLSDMQERMIYSFATLVESRDVVTGEHVRRTSAYVTILAKELRRRGKFAATITNKYLDYLRLAAPLHDIGKMTVPDSVLKKPGKLSPEEFEIMKNHTIQGGRILDDTLKGIEGESYFDVAKEVAVYHHEKWNGTGYPYGINGDKIPLSARIMAVADFFDALTSSRPYKKAYSVDKAYSIIQDESGKTFDPQIVECFMTVRPEVEKVIIEFNGALPEDDGPLSERDMAAANENKE